MQKLRYRGIKELSCLTAKCLNWYLNQSACPKSPCTLPLQVCLYFRPKSSYMNSFHCPLHLKFLCTFFIFVQNCQSSFPSFTPAPVPFPPIINPSFSFFFFLYKEQGTSVKLTCFLFLLLSTQTFALVVPRCL